jgi:4-alpha-glucanotransferase
MMWWDEDEERAQNYYHTVLFHEGDAPHPMPASLAEEIVSSHLACPSMVCVIALQDWLAIDEHIRLEDANAERVNIPANPKHYWRYRMHLNIEDLIAADDFNAKICKLVSLHER